jgi:UDP-glucuronate 4-epimerase
MVVLVTGSAGFIGSEVTLRLLNDGHQVVGIDNHNPYYDPALKEARVARFQGHQNYVHLRLDLCDKASLCLAFSNYRPKKVINLAAQAGVRYSIENPEAYINSNIVGFLNVLEACKLHHVDHLVYASTSSVYGANAKLPFSTHQSANHPLTLYAATKKSNELMAHAYSHLFELPTTGLRFFTVYGPWGRPDMALFKFTKAILNDEPIEVFNFGNHRRDFTYVDDIVEVVVRVLEKPAQKNPNWDGTNPDPASSQAPWKLYNIGNTRPIDLLTYISAIERALGKKAEKKLLPMQQGDVLETCADVQDLIEAFNYRPLISVEEGVGKFISWYREYYKV